MLYRQEINGLRAIAVIAVILFHAGFKTFSGGFVGVDVFFVVSGYVITAGILAEKAAGSFSFLGFYERRVRRILPALFVVMFACLPFAWFWLLPADLHSFSTSLAVVPSFIANVWFYLHNGYFDPLTELKPLLHTWSLAVEAQFYILFPIFLLFIWRLGKRGILVALLLVALVSLALAQINVLKNYEYSFYLLQARAWQLLIGAVLAVYLDSKNSDQSTATVIQQLGSLSGLLLILYAIFSVDSQTAFSILPMLLPTIGAALIIVFANQHSWVAKLLSAKLLVLIGLISYSAYLWHQPIFVFARQRTITQPSTGLMLALIALVLILAYFTWKYIEVPFRDRQRLSQQQVFLYAAVVGMLFMQIGLIGDLNKGFPQRFTAPIIAISSAITDKNPNETACITGGINFNNPQHGCVLGNANAINAALVGDSHADSISFALSQALQRKQQGAQEFAYSGCAPIVGFVRTGPFKCAEYNAAVRNILRTKPVTTIILLARWTKYLEGNGFNNTEGGAENTALWADANVNKLDHTRSLAVRQQAIAASYKDYILELLASGKKIILVYPIPEVAWNVPVFAAKNRLFNNDTSDVTTSYAAFKHRNKTAIAVLDSIGTHKNLIRIRPDQILCDTYVKQRCVAQLQGVPLYYDDNHLSNAGAKLIVDKITQHLD